MEQTVRFCTTLDRVRIAYATVGRGCPLAKAADGLNHLEFNWQCPIWRPLLDELARDHFLVRYGERGNGPSDWDVDELSLEAFVSDLEAVALRCLEKPPGERSQTAGEVRAALEAVSG